MNVYDFDNTIYDGESTVDFFKFCIKHDKSLLRLFPLMVVKLIKYKLCLISHEEIEAYIGKYSKALLKAFPNIEELSEQFWERNIRKIKKFYLETKQPDDIILSASFGFLLKYPAEKLGIKNVICSEIDLKSGRLIKLCYKEKKVEFLKEFLEDGKGVSFYTDSMNDNAMIEFAEHSYFVKGDKIKRIK